MPGWLREALETMREAVRSFSSHGGRVHGAATAFYGLLAAAPILLMGLVVTGVLIDREEARAQAIGDLGLFIGEDAAALLSKVLDNLAESHGGPLAGTVSAVVLTWAGMRLFSQLRYSLNHLWGVRERRTSGLSGTALKQLRRRASALTMVVLGVLLVTLTVLTKAALGRVMQVLGGGFQTRWHVLELAISLVIMTIAFFATYKVLPSVRIASRDALVGAVVTSVLFNAGAVLIGVYLGYKSTPSTYGAAGSVVALLIWTYYSAQVYFLGAAFTRAYAERHGRGVELTEHAVKIVEEGEPPVGAARDEPPRAQEPADDEEPTDDDERT